MLSLKSLFLLRVLVLESGPIARASFYHDQTHQMNESSDGSYHTIELLSYLLWFRIVFETLYC